MGRTCWNRNEAEKLVLKLMTKKNGDDMTKGGIMYSIQDRVRDDYSKIALENHEDTILIATDSSENVSSRFSLM